MHHFDCLIKTKASNFTVSPGCVCVQMPLTDLRVGVRSHCVSQYFKKNTIYKIMTFARMAYETFTMVAIFIAEKDTYGIDAI